MAKAKRNVVKLGKTIEPHMINCAGKFDGTDLCIQDVEGRHVVTLLIMMFQSIDKWKPFTLAELSTSFQEQSGTYHRFQTLVEEGWFILRDDGRYVISPNLIAECHHASTETLAIAAPEALTVSIPIPAPLSAA